MNKQGNAGAILVIVAGAIMIITGLLLLLGGSTIFAAVSDDPRVDPDALAMLGIVLSVLSGLSIFFGILDIVIASLALKSRVSRVGTGVLAIISILFGFLFYFIPSILLLVGGILLFCGKDNENIEPVASHISFVENIVE